MPIEVIGIKLYSLLELSKILKATTVTLRSYIKQGKLRAKKLAGKWYATEDALRKFLEQEPREKEERQLVL